jgi:putative phosphoribosyl transferase
VLFIDRSDAGRQLAHAMGSVPENSLILAIPRGGVIVARAMADALGVQFDVIVVRKVGAPQNPELALGAVGPDGEVSLTEDVVHSLPSIPAGYVEHETERARAEIERRMRTYRGDRPFPSVADRPCVLVDDGIATGSTARAALSWLRDRRATPLVLAVPVAPAATVAELRSEADQVICLSAPSDFFAVGQWYERFDQVSDEEVIEALAGSRNLS